MAAHLASKGIDADQARAAIDEAPAEADAALALCRKRRIGPFAREAADAAVRKKWLGILARAGYSRAIADAALDTDPETAEARIIVLKR
jgi:regulatory protein